MDKESFFRVDIQNFLNSVAEPKNKKIFPTTLEFLDKVEKTDYRSGKTSIVVSDLDLETQAIFFPMLLNNPFYETFEDIIQRLTEAGICPYRLIAKFFTFMKSEMQTNKMFDEEIPALVLSMEDLGIGFEFCLIPLLLSLLVFSFEVIYPRLEKYLTALTTIVVFFNSFKPGLEVT